MITTRNLAIVGTVCALAVVPITPRSIEESGGIPLVASASAQTVTRWRNPNDDVWNDGGNWDNDVPDSSKEAEHETETAVITVNVANAACAKFTGSGKAPNDRYLIIDSGNELSVVGDAVGTKSPFVFRFKNGVSSSDLTTLLVGGNATLLKLIPERGIGVVGQYLKIDITGDVSDSDITMGDSGVLNIDGDLSGINSEVVTLGTSGGTGATVANVGSVGGATATETTDWNLRGETVLTVTGDYDGVTTSHFPVFTMTDSSEATVGGTTTGAVWDLSNVSKFTGTGDILSSGILGADIWKLTDDARVIASDDIHGGVWTVRSDGGISGIAVDVTDEFGPDTLIVSGGTVECEDLGIVEAPVGIDLPAWDMVITSGGDVDATQGAWFAGVQEGQFNFPTDEDSKLTYGSTGNVLATEELYMACELINTSGTSALTLDIGRLFWPQPEIVRVVSGVTEVIDWDTEGVTVDIAEGVSGFLFEVTGPDYIYDDAGSDMGFNDSRVLFSDSPCVRRWAEVVFRNSTASGAQMNLIDLYGSTPISGNSGGGSPGFVHEYLDALYTIDLTVEDGALVNTDPSANPPGAGGPVLSVYYTGDCTLLGCGACDDAGCATELNAAFAGRKPIKLEPTLFGDFDADGEGDETADTDLFIDAWCTCGRDDTHCTFADYTPLQDFDCDGDVDNDDLDQYESKRIELGQRNAADDLGLFVSGGLSADGCM